MAWPAPRLWRTEHHGARNHVAEIVINSFSGDVCGLFIVIFSVPPPSENPGCAPDSDSCLIVGERREAIRPYVTGPVAAGSGTVCERLCMDTYHHL